jgi:hypothetical protein
MAEMGALYSNSGDPLQVANALRQLGWSDMAGIGPGKMEPNAPMAITSLLALPGVSERLVAARRERLGMRDPKVFTDASILEGWKEEAAKLINIPGQGDKVREELFNAVNNVVGGDDPRAKFQAAMHEWHPGVAIAEWWERDFGSKRKLSSGETEWLNDYISGRLAGKSPDELIPPNPNEKTQASLRKERESLKQELLKNDRVSYDKTYDNFSAGAGPGHWPTEDDTSKVRRFQEISTILNDVTLPRYRELGKAGEAYLGDLKGFMGGTPSPVKDLMPLGPAQFSFSSLSGFANKMQTEAGVYLDWNKENHGVLEEIRDTLRLRMPSNEREILAHEGIRG